MSSSTTSAPRHELALVHEARRQKDWIAAISLLEPLIESHPTLEVRILWADSLLHIDDLHRAGPLITQLLAEAPHNPRVLTLAAERHRLEHRPEESTRLYLEALSLRDDGYVRSRAIDGLLALQRNLDASRLIDEGLQLHPSDPWLLRRKARLLAVEHPDQAASLMASLARTGGDERDQAESIRLRLEALPEPDRLLELQKLLKLESYRGNRHLVILAIESALDAQNLPLVSAWMDLLKPLDALPIPVLKRLAFVHNKLGQFDGVLDALGPVFIHDPRDIVVQQVLWAAARKSRRWEQLRSILNVAYQQHPGHHKLNGLLKKVEKELKP